MPGKRYSLRVTYQSFPAQRAFSTQLAGALAALPYKSRARRKLGRRARELLYTAEVIIFPLAYACTVLQGSSARKGSLGRFHQGIPVDPAGRG